VLTYSSLICILVQYLQTSYLRIYKKMLTNILNYDKKPPPCVQWYKSPPLFPQLKCYRYQTETCFTYFQTLLKLNVVSYRKLFSSHAVPHSCVQLGFVILFAKSLNKGVKTFFTIRSLLVQKLCNFTLISKIYITFVAKRTAEKLFTKNFWKMVLCQFSAVLSE